MASVVNVRFIYFVVVVVVVAAAAAGASSDPTNRIDTLARYELSWYELSGI